jgi:hypothetical protein
MTPTERLDIAASAIKNYNNDNIEMIDDISSEDLARIAVDTEIKDSDYNKLIGIMVYIRKRLVEKLSRTKAFEASFPERCVHNGEATRGGATNFVASKKGSALVAGDPISRSAIDLKAKRLESTKLYMKVYQLLKTNLYVAYAVERMKVLDEALEKSLSPHVSDRDKPAFMKLFLEETRKPEGAKGLEVSFNLTQNNVSIASVEDRMNSIAEQLKSSSAADIIDIVHQDRSEEE